MTADLSDHLRRALAQTSSASSDYDLVPDISLPEGRKLRPAAVLIPILTGPVPRVLLTKRSSALKHHPGQVAFPGGKIDPADDGAIGAALREAQEEIGLAPSRVEVLGALPPHETVTSFSVTPVLGVIDAPFRPVPEAGEVAEVFEVPLAHVMDPSRYVVEGRIWRGEVRRYYAVPWGPYYIWGATARMLRGLADRIRDADLA